jgi:hypothetical protein
MFMKKILKALIISTCLIFSTLETAQSDVFPYIPVEGDNLFTFSILKVPYGFETEKSWGRIITNQDQWASLYNEMLSAYNKKFTDRNITPPKSISEPSFDFNNYQMVIGGLGARGGSGHDLLVEKVEETADAIHITISEVTSSKCGELAVVTYPSAAILIKKSNKPIVFDGLKSLIREC